MRKNKRVSAEDFFDQFANTNRSSPQSVPGKRKCTTFQYFQALSTTPEDDENSNQLIKFNCPYADFFSFTPSLSTTTKTTTTNGNTVIYANSRKLLLRKEAIETAKWVIKQAALLLAPTFCPDLTLELYYLSVWRSKRSRYDPPGRISSISGHELIDQLKLIEQLNYSTDNISNPLSKRTEDLLKQLKEGLSSAKPKAFDPRYPLSHGSAQRNCARREKQKKKRDNYSCTTPPALPTAEEVSPAPLPLANNIHCDADSILQAFSNITVMKKPPQYLSLVESLVPSDHGDSTRALDRCADLTANSSTSSPQQYVPGNTLRQACSFPSKIGPTHFPSVSAPQLGGTACIDTYPQYEEYCLDHAHQQQIIQREQNRALQESIQRQYSNTRPGISSADITQCLNTYNKSCALRAAHQLPADSSSTLNGIVGVSHQQSATMSISSSSGGNDSSSSMCGGVPSGLFQHPMEYYSRQQHCDIIGIATEEKKFPQAWSFPCESPSHYSNTIRRKNQQRTVTTENCGDALSTLDRRTSKKINSKISKIDAKIREINQGVPQWTHPSSDAPERKQQYCLNNASSSLSSPIEGQATSTNPQTVDKETEEIAQGKTHCRSPEGFSTEESVGESASSTLEQEYTRLVEHLQKEMVKLEAVIAGLCSTSDDREKKFGVHAQASPSTYQKNKNSNIMREKSDESVRSQTKILDETLYNRPQFSTAKMSAALPSDYPSRTEIIISAGSDSALFQQSPVESSCLSSELRSEEETQNGKRTNHYHPHLNLWVHYYAGYTRNRHWNHESAKIHRNWTTTAEFTYYQQSFPDFPFAPIQPKNWSDVKEEHYNNYSDNSGGAVSSEDAVGPSVVKANYLYTSKELLFMEKALSDIGNQLMNEPEMAVWIVLASALRNSCLLQIDDKCQQKYQQQHSVLCSPMPQRRSASTPNFFLSRDSSFCAVADLEKRKGKYTPDFCDVLSPPSSDDNPGNGPTHQSALEGCSTTSTQEAAHRPHHESHTNVKEKDSSKVHRNNTDKFFRRANPMHLDPIKSFFPRDFEQFFTRKELAEKYPQASEHFVSQILTKIFWNALCSDLKTAKIVHSCHPAPASIGNTSGSAMATSVLLSATSKSSGGTGKEMTAIGEKTMPPKVDKTEEKNKTGRCSRCGLSQCSCGDKNVVDDFRHWASYNTNEVYDECSTTILDHYSIVAYYDSTMISTNNAKEYNTNNPDNRREKASEKGTYTSDTDNNKHIVRASDNGTTNSNSRRTTPTNSPKIAESTTVSEDATKSFDILAWTIRTFGGRLANPAARQEAWNLMNKKWHDKTYFFIIRIKLKNLVDFMAKYQLI